MMYDPRFATKLTPQEEHDRLIRFGPRKCPLCEKKHGSDSRYYCKTCKKTFCASQIEYIYRDGHNRESPYINECIEKFACPDCKEKVETI